MRRAPHMFRGLLDHCINKRPSLLSLTSCFRRSLPTNEKLRLCVDPVVLALHLSRPGPQFVINFSFSIST